MRLHLLRALHSRWAIRRDPVAFARSLGVRVGQDCRFLGMTATTFGTEPYLIDIGNHVTITAGVRFVTHDGGIWVLRGRYPDIDLIKPIRVGDNVFIGLNSIILPGVRIGDDCIVGAGAVVTRNVGPGTVVGGIPARQITTTREYEERVLPEAVHVRAMPQEQKRAWLLSRVRERDERQ